MNWHIIKHDFIRNKAINIGLLLFIVFSSTLTIISTLVAVQTITSINELYSVAQPPHFLQMHKGDIDIDEIETFMSEDSRVSYWQVVTMIDVLGDQLTLTQGNQSVNLKDFRLDIGLVKQNGERDLLLNADHQKVEIEPGDIGIPALMKTMYDINIGDTVTLTSGDYEIALTVSTIVLDAQMNSPLTSSTRILLSDDDFTNIASNIPNFEYLIEVYLYQSSDINSFETDYQNAGLPQDGQAVNYNIIFILSAMTDIITVFVLLIVSILLIIMSFICIKFTMLAAIEEEIQEIGTMKAIGLSHKDIRQIYLSKYRFISVVGIVIGYVLAIITSPLFTNHISTTFGNVPLSWLAIGLSILAALYMFVMISIYAKRVIKKLKKITVVDTLVRGQGLGKSSKLAKKGLYQSKRLPTNILLSIREVVHHLKSWAVVFILILIVSTMILIPFNILFTFESEDFITYMGSSKEDVLIEVNPGNELEDRTIRVTNVLASSGEVENYYVYKTIRMKTYDIGGELYNLDVDTGDQAGSGLQYLKGSAPQGEQQIALSLLNAEVIGKDVGETLIIFLENLEYTFEISGVYQDVTSGGYTAKIDHTYPSVEGQSYMFAINLRNPSRVQDITDDWAIEMGYGVKVYPMDDYIKQTLGGVANQLRTMAYGIFILGLGLTMLVQVLFLKLRLVKDYSEIAILKAIGFSNRDLDHQYLYKIGFITILGLIVGILLTVFLGDQLVRLGLSFAQIGIREVVLIPNISMMIFTPIILSGASLLITKLALRQIRCYRIMSIIQE